MSATVEFAVRKEVIESVIVVTGRAGARVRDAVRRQASTGAVAVEHVLQRSRGV